MSSGDSQSRISAVSGSFWRSFPVCAVYFSKAAARIDCKLEGAAGSVVEDIGMMEGSRVHVKVSKREDLNPSPAFDKKTPEDANHQKAAQIWTIDARSSYTASGDEH